MRKDNLMYNHYVNKAYIMKESEIKGFELGIDD